MNVSTSTSNSQFHHNTFFRAESRSFISLISGSASSRVPQQKRSETFQLGGFARGFLPLFEGQKGFAQKTSRQPNKIHVLLQDCSSTFLTENSGQLQLRSLAKTTRGFTSCKNVVEIRK